MLRLRQILQPANGIVLGVNMRTLICPICKAEVIIYETKMNRNKTPDLEQKIRDLAEIVQDLTSIL